MKRIILTLIILVIGFVWFFQPTECKLEKTKVHQFAIPIVKSIAKYIDKNGIPKSLDDVLIPCKGNKRVNECYGSGDRRYFTLKKDAYSFFGNSYTADTYIFSIAHHNTKCEYKISLGKDKKILRGVKNFMIPRCWKSCGGGVTWWRM